MYVCSIIHPVCTSYWLSIVNIVFVTVSQHPEMSACLLLTFEGLYADPVVASKYGSRNACLLLHNIIGFVTGFTVTGLSLFLHLYLYKLNTLLMAAA